jgi:hypothetical protein
MTTVPDEPEPQEEPSGHRLAYLVAAGVIGLLLVLGFVFYEQKEQNAEAERKAEQLIGEFEAAGLRTPQDISIVTSVLGTTGGALCETSDEDLTQAWLKQQLVNGAAHVGIRPTEVDERVVQGEKIVISVYCPDRLPAFEELVDGFDFSDVIRDD